MCKSNANKIFKFKQFLWLGIENVMLLFRFYMRNVIVVDADGNYFKLCAIHSNWKRCIYIFRIYILIFDTHFLELNPLVYLYFPLFRLLISCSVYPNENQSVRWIFLHFLTTWTLEMQWDQTLRVFQLYQIMHSCKLWLIDFNLFLVFCFIIVIIWFCREWMKSNVSNFFFPFVTNSHEHKIFYYNCFLFWCLVCGFVYIAFIYSMQFTRISEKLHSGSLLIPFFIFYMSTC